MAYNVGSEAQQREVLLHEPNDRRVAHFDGHHAAIGLEHCSMDLGHGAAGDRSLVELGEDVADRAAVRVLELIWSTNPTRTSERRHMATSMVAWRARVHCV